MLRAVLLHAQPRLAVREVRLLQVVVPGQIGTGCPCLDSGCLQDGMRLMQCPLLELGGDVLGWLRGERAGWCVMRSCAGCAVWCVQNRLATAAGRACAVGKVCKKLRGKVYC